MNHRFKLHLEQIILKVERTVLKAHIFLLIVALIYGANYSIAKLVLNDGYIAPNGFILIRAGLGFVLFFLFHHFFIQERVERKDIPLIALCGLFGVAINQLCFFNGLKLTSSVHASLIMLTAPMLVLIASSILLKEKITLIRIVGLIIGASGAALLILNRSSSSAGEASIGGDLLILVNASSYAIYLVIVKRLMKKYNPLTIVKWVFFFGFLYVIPFGYKEFIQIQVQTFTTQIWLAVAFVIIGTTFLAYLLNAKALTLVNPTVVSAYIYLQPLVATIIAILFSAYRLEGTTILSAILISIGLYLSAFFNYQKK